MCGTTKWYDDNTYIRHCKVLHNVDVESAFTTSSFSIDDVDADRCWLALYNPQQSRFFSSQVNKYFCCIEFLFVFNASFVVAKVNRTRAPSWPAQALKNIKNIIMLINAERFPLCCTFTPRTKRAKSGINMSTRNLSMSTSNGTNATAQSCRLQPLQLVRIFL